MNKRDEREDAAMLERDGAEIERLERELAAARYAGELLAVMHGDGGHYITDHGWRKAVDDAITKRSEMLIALDDARAESERHRKVIGTTEDAAVQWMDACKAVRAEAEALRHDMERQADTLAELATENEALRNELDEASPWLECVICGARIRQHNAMKEDDETEWSCLPCWEGCDAA